MIPAKCANTFLELSRSESGGYYDLEEDSNEDMGYDCFCLQVIRDEFGLIVGVEGPQGVWVNLCGLANQNRTNMK